MPTPFGLTTPIKVVNPSSDLDSLYGPYPTINDALTATQNLRQPGKTVGIITDPVYDGEYITGGTVVEYWFKEGILDEDLVAKTEGVFIPIAGNSISNPITGNLYFKGNQSPLGINGDNGGGIRFSNGNILLYAGNDQGSEYIINFIAESGITLGSKYVNGIKYPSSGINYTPQTLVTKQYVDDAIDNIEPSDPNLQQVTSNGNITTTFIDANYFKSNGKVISDSNGKLYSNNSRFDIVGTKTATINATNLSENRVHDLPDKSGVIALVDDINSIVLNKYEYTAIGGELSFSNSVLVNRVILSVFRVQPYKVVTSTPAFNEVQYSASTGTLTFNSAYSLSTGEYILVLFQTSTGSLVSNNNAIEVTVNTYADMMSRLPTDNPSIFIKYIVLSDENADNTGASPSQYIRYQGQTYYTVKTSIT